MGLGRSLWLGDYFVSARPEVKPMRTHPRHRHGGGQRGFLLAERAVDLSVLFLIAGLGAAMLVGLVTGGPPPTW